MDHTIGVSQLRAHTCSYLDLVDSGDRLHVLRRGRVIATIQPIALRGEDGIESRATPLPVDLNSFRSRASRHLDVVASGRTLCVVRHGRPVAYVVPLTAEADSADLAHV